MKCPKLSEIAGAVSEYYQKGLLIPAAIEKAVKDFNHSPNIDRQVGPLRIINDCQSYEVKDNTTLRAALSKICGTHGGLVTSEKRRSAA